MKSTIVGLILAFAMVLVSIVPAVAVEKDVAPEWGTPAWTEYMEADAAAKEARASGDYLKAAALTPFKWAEAWHLYNAAGKEFCKERNQEGLWVFALEKGTTYDSKYLDRVASLLYRAREAMKLATLNVPTAGPNTPENLYLVVNNALKGIGKTD